MHKYYTEKSDPKKANYGKDKNVVLANLQNNVPSIAL
jgi:hypothetical protein